MRIKVITEVGHPGQPYTRQIKEIPPGSWGVIVIRQTEDRESHSFAESRTVSITTIGKTPNEEVLTHSYIPSPYANMPFTEICLDPSEYSGLTVEKVLYWSDEPFVIIEEWESPLHGKWAHPACLITEHGLTSGFPEINMPKPDTSLACSYGGQPTKWVRLADLAKRCGLDPLELMRRHKAHFEGFDPGVYIVRAADAEELMELEDHPNYHTTWSRPDWDAFFSTDPRDAWVRLRFARVVMYLHMLGWHDQFQKAASV